MEKYMKYDSTMEIKIHVFRFGKGDENKNLIDRLQVKVNFTRREKKVTVAVHTSLHIISGTKHLCI